MVTKFNMKDIEDSFDKQKSKIETRGRAAEVWSLILVFGTLGIFKQLGENHPTVWYILISIYLLFIVLSSVFVCY